MPSREIENKLLIPALNNLAFLIQWLRPGVLSFRISQIKGAVEPDAVRVQKEHQALIDDCVMSEQPSDDKKRKRKTRTNDLGQQVYDFGTREAEFEERFEKLMNDKTRISVTRWLTFTDIERVEKERVERLPKGADGKHVELQSVDWSALACVMDTSDDKAAHADEAEREINTDDDDDIGAERMKPTPSARRAGHSKARP